QPVSLQLELLDDGRQADEDVRAATEIEAIAGDDLLGGHRPAYDPPALENRHPVPRACEIRRGHQRVVAGADDDGVVVVRSAAGHRATSRLSAGPGVARVPGGPRKSSSPCTTSTFVTRKKTASSRGRGPS